MIVLSGMIGVGKTTYAKELEGHFASQAFYESVDDNPILAKFYADPEQYAFLSQLYFLSTRFASSKQASVHGRGLLDRSIIEDVLFAEVNHDLGRMTAEEKIVYDGLAKNLVAEVKGFTDQRLYVYLKASFDTIKKRIALRDRAIEQDPKLLEYYKALHVRYDDWMHEHVDPAQLLVIDTDRYDIKRKEDKAEVFNQITIKLQTMGF